jgi:hypothetical protein
MKPSLPHADLVGRDLSQGCRVKANGTVASNFLPTWRLPVRGEALPSRQRFPVRDLEERECKWHEKSHMMMPGGVGAVRCLVLTAGAFSRDL